MYGRLWIGCVWLQIEFYITNRITCNTHISACQTTHRLCTCHKLLKTALATTWENFGRGRCFARTENWNLLARLSSVSVSGIHRLEVLRNDLKRDFRAACSSVIYENTIIKWRKRWNENFALKLASSSSYVVFTSLESFFPFAGDVLVSWPCSVLNQFYMSVGVFVMFESSVIGKLSIVSRANNQMKLFVKGIFVRPIGNCYFEFITNSLIIQTWWVAALW